MAKVLTSKTFVLELTEEEARLVLATFQNVPEEFEGTETARLYEHIFLALRAELSSF